MKKKIALLLAAAMTLSMLPMNVFAASTNSLTRNISVMPENTLMAEEGTTGLYTKLGPHEVNDVDYLAEAPYLKIELKDHLPAGSEVKLILENAKWFFRDWTEDDYKDDGGSGIHLPETYNTTYGTWSGTGAGYKTYTRTSGSGLRGVGYTLHVSESNNKIATVVFPESANRDDVVYIPMVILTTEASDVKVRLESNTMISSGTYMIGSASGTLTTTTVGDPQDGRDTFKIDKLIVRENRIGSIGRDGWFEIKAPAGFEFNDPGNAEIWTERGLGWGTAGADGKGVRNSDYLIRYKNDGYDIDPSILEVRLMNIGKSNTVTGAVYITGLVLYADENAAMGPINLTVRNITKRNEGANDDILTNQTNVLAGTRIDWAVTFKTITDVPTLVNGRYDPENNPYSANDDFHQTAKVEFSENAINSWWANRYTSFILPEQVKFRKVEITDQDNIVHNKDVVGDDLITGGTDGIYVNTGKKQHKVTIDGNVMTWQNLEIKSNEKAKIKFDIWVSIESGFEGDVTLAAEAALSTTNSRITTDQDIPSIVIAKAVNPITIETKVTDVKVGYQYQATADIIIKETAAGRLLRGRDVLVSVSDLISSDMILKADKVGEVTEGDIKFTNWSHTSGGYARRTTSGSALGSNSSLYGTLGNEGGAISFRISQPSSKASTIKISNLFVKLDRAVPETNKQYYKAVVWGTAIAENFGSYGRNYLDTFDTPGITADYIKVVSSADNNALLNSEVKVTIGESYYTVNGVTYDMDAAAYISPASNSTMVPIRFMAYALGLDENTVIWDDTNRTVTLLHPSRIIQFTINNSTMLIAGAPVTMTSPDGKPVVAEIKNDRSYIPFRAFGDAFGVPVTWKADTQTAIYNEGAIVSLQ